MGYRRTRRNFFSSLPLFCLRIFFVCVAASSSLLAAENRVALVGHIPKHLEKATRLERLPTDERIRLSLVVNLDQELMKRTLDEIYSQPPGQRHFLTSAEFAQKFSVAEKRQRLREFAQASGFDLDSDDRPSSQHVKVSAPAGLIEKAFGLELRRYRGPDGRVFRGHETEPLIPASLVPHLGSILGLSNSVVAHPHLQPHLQPGSAAVAGPASAGAPRPALLTGGSGPQGGLGPADIKAIYGLSGGLTGAGQEVAIFELDGFVQTDIDLYTTHFGIPSLTVNYTSPDATPNLCGPFQADACNGPTLAGTQGDEGGNSDNGMIEVALDIEMVEAMVPGATSLQIYTCNLQAGNYLTCYDQIATDNTCKVVSTSWGTAVEQQNPAYMTAEYSTDMQLAMQGQTLYAAAGDNGAYDCGGESQLCVDDPGAQPYVTSVGGTSLSGTVSPVSVTETVWNNGYNQNAGAFIGGGGGVANYVSGSTYFPIPSYQTGVSGLASNSYRNVPDVALNADPVSSPYSVCVGASCNNCNMVTCTTLIGGTSAAAPLWAGLTALANQQRATYFGHADPLGQANTYFYILGPGSAYTSVFNDITSGSNGAFAARIGYDNASGWGSFKANQMIDAMTALPVTAAPSPLTASVLGVSSITFSWSPVANETQYNLNNAFPPFNSYGNQAGTNATWTGLTPNTRYGVQVQGANFWMQGPAVTVFVGATLANLPVFQSYQAYPSSITVTFTPGAGGDSGFALYGSTVVDTYSGTLFSSTTNSGAVTSLTLTGLAPVTTYYLRLGSSNQSGVTTYVLAGSTQTANPYFAPPIPIPPSLATNQITFYWAEGANPPLINYSADCSTAANFTGTVFNHQGVDVFSAVFAGLSPTTSYYFRVKADYSIYSATGPYATLAVPPVTASPAFTNVAASSLIAQWGSGGDNPGAAYLVEASTDPTPAFYPVVSTSETYNTFGLLQGLAANTVYYARVRAISFGGVATTFVALGSTATLSAPPIPTVFINQTTTGFTAQFTNGGNAAGTIFLGQISVDPTAAFNPIAGSSQTANTYATFTGLIPNQKYFFRAGAYSSLGAVNFDSFAQEISTYTAPLLPAIASVVGGNQTVNSIRLFWTNGPNAAGTPFTAQTSADPLFGSGVQTVAGTPNDYADFGGLAANTTYFLRAQALPQVGSIDPPSAFVNLGGAATLANPPPVPGAPIFRSVTFTSVTVQYPTVAPCEGYLIEAAADPAFATTIFSSAVAGSATNTAGITGLTPATTYYFRVGSLNWNGVPNFTLMGSTYTLVPVEAVGTVGSGGLNLSVNPAAGTPLTNIQFMAGPGVLPPGIVVTLNTSVQQELPAPVSNEATITPIGGGVGFSIDAQGMQPTGSVQLILSYNPLLLPAGASAQNIQLARYDTTAGQWTLLPTSIDTSQNVATAQIGHFSFYEPFLVTAGGDLGSVNIFPIPWEQNSSNALLNASVLTFSNLPPSAGVRVLTLRGELVWQGTAGPNGVLTWNGENNHGRTLGSGTFMAIIDSGSNHIVKRVVIIR
jgi:kumamolisin